MARASNVLRILWRSYRVDHGVSYRLSASFPLPESSTSAICAHHGLPLYLSISYRFAAASVPASQCGFYCLINVVRVGGRRTMDAWQSGHRRGAARPRA